MNEEKSFYIVIEKVATKLRALQVILGKDSYER
jgi:hypothetical protein